MTSDVTTQAGTVSWFKYFPNDYRWSAAMSNVLGSAPFGGSDIAEAHFAGARLVGEEGDDEAWFREWSAVAERVRDEAAAAEANGKRVTAAAAYLRSVTYFHIAERFRTEKDADALRVFAEGVRAFESYAHLTTTPLIEVVEVPFESALLPAYFVHAARSPRGATPSVVFLDGLDITKELQYLKGISELVKRGISCLILDGPGYGVAIRERGMRLRHDYEVVGTAALEYLLTRDDVDADRIGVMGISLGGYYVSRCASFEPRFAAAAAWGAIWDYRETWQRRVAASGVASLSVPQQHLLWILGADDYPTALDLLANYRLDTVAGQISCPFLVMHGEDDEQIPLADAVALHKAVGAADKTLKVFTAAEGGAQHCQRDYLTAGSSYLFDWFQDKLFATTTAVSRG